MKLAKYFWVVSYMIFFIITSCANSKRLNGLYIGKHYYQKNNKSRCDQIQLGIKGNSVSIMKLPVNTTIDSIGYNSYTMVSEDFYFYSGKLKAIGDSSIGNLLLIDCNKCVLESTDTLTSKIAKIYPNDYPRDLNIVIKLSENKLLLNGIPLERKSAKNK